MDNFRKTLALILQHDTKQLEHNAIFTCNNAAVFAQLSRHRRASLPRDAVDYRVLIEHPGDSDLPPWEVEALVAVRGGRVWHPAVHLQIVGYSAPDTDNEDAIRERADDWARSL